MLSLLSPAFMQSHLAAHKPTAHYSDSNSQDRSQVNQSLNQYLPRTPLSLTAPLFAMKVSLGTHFPQHIPLL